VHECPSWELRFGRPPAAIAKREPKLLDPVYVVIAGAVLDEPDSAWARLVLSDPRRVLGGKLEGFSDERIASVVATIRATPAGQLFAGSLHRSVGGANPFRKPELLGVCAERNATQPRDDPEHQETIQ
jgi:hypothetical protein